MVYSIYLRIHNMANLYNNLELESELEELRHQKEVHAIEMDAAIHHPPRAVHVKNKKISELEERLQSSEKEAKKYWDNWNQAVEAETTLQAENKLLKRRLQSAYSDINESKTVEDLERLKEQISLLEPPVAEIFPDGWDKRYTNGGLEERGFVYLL